MKRWIALLIALLLCAACALAEPMSALDYTDNILEDGSLIYYFQELSLELPADWHGKVMAVQSEYGVSFYQIASYEKYQAEGLDGGGFLFELCAGADEEYRDILPAFADLGYSRTTGLYYYLMLPTDYPPYDEVDIRAEYDAMHAQLDYVTDHAAFYPSVDAVLPGEAASGDAKAEDAEGAADAADTAVTLKQARYYFEHNALPRYFYEDPANMLDVLGRVGVYRLWCSLADENGVDYPYQAEDFTENRYVTDGGATLLQIVMPKPEDKPLCFRIYLAYDPETGKAGYYTAEYENLLGDDCFICGWTEAHDHVNFGGAAPLDSTAADYDAALLAEAEEIAKLAGLSTPLKRSPA